MLEDLSKSTKYLQVLALLSSATDLQCPNIFLFTMLLHRGCMGGLIYGWTNGQAEGWKEVWIKEWMDGWEYEQIDGQVNGFLNGLMVDEWTYDT